MWLLQRRLNEDRLGMFRLRGARPRGAQAVQVFFLAALRQINSTGDEEVSQYGFEGVREGTRPVSFVRK
jgi:hypothetical protein